ncbi:unnamed protein product [Cyprideis torosa]|uniref:Uncharacterized protein n=1 Tax=Cyprideis torosa TaxID=163714 RepID=A0A7R8ZQ37_9CRUS|nr:unnamed protein product [Cyprideis torosa]CAG0902012.1 unnamed protein product [Cyprideis torosa]
MKTPESHKSINSCSSGCLHKMKASLFILVTFCALVFADVIGGGRGKKKSRDCNGKVLMCYYGSWAHYRTGNGKFTVEDIDPWACTHLIYSFAKIEGNQLVSYDSWLDLPGNLDNYRKFVALKQTNPDLKLMIAVGGWNAGSVVFSQMAANQASRATFVQSCVSFLQTYKFDGLDVDWEYPAQFGGLPQDKVRCKAMAGSNANAQNLVALLSELKAAFAPHGFLLTAAVGVGIDKIGVSYDVAGLNHHLDYINLMMYDMNGVWNGYAHHHAPLQAHPLDTGALATNNINSALAAWIQNGASRSKLVLGMPLYGRGFLLDNAYQTGIHAPAHTASPAGPYTQQAGFLGYNEICALEMKSSTNLFDIKFDSDIKGTYVLVKTSAYWQTWWIGFDDTNSLSYKVNLIKDEGLAGGMVWSIETDDFTGYCNGGKNPLLWYLSDNLVYA